MGKIQEEFEESKNSVPECYSSYLNRMDELAEIHHVSSEQLEKFLFTYQA